MLRHAALIATCVAVMILNAPLAGAHDSWINKGAYRNAAGDPAPAWDGSSTVLNSFLLTKNHLVSTAKYGSVGGRTRRDVACSDLRRIREYGFAERERGPAGRVAQPEKVGEAAKERGLAKASSRTKSSRSPVSDNRSLRLSEASTELFGAGMVEYDPGINACIAHRQQDGHSRLRRVDDRRNPVPLAPHGKAS